MPTPQQRAAHFVASGYGVDVCSECGLVATAHEACLACKSPFPAARWAAPKNADGTFWVRVSPGFRCTECQRDSPLNHFDLDGQVTCLQCQSSNQFEPRGWLVVVNEAHAVGDLRGPNPTWEAPGESYAQVGVSINGTGVFLGEVSVEACPGHPLCDSCRVPLRLTFRHTPVIELQCPLCQHPPRRFELPPGAAELFPALRGAYCVYHEAGRQDARVVEDAGAHKLTCPGCGGALTFPDGSAVTTCGYCNTQCRVGHRSLVSVSGVRVAAQPWWLLLKGPSPVRRAHGAG